MLARFEGFPSKKLESLRTADALYSKLDGAVSKLKGWKLATPVWKQLDRVEGYFSKVCVCTTLLEWNVPRHVHQQCTNTCGSCFCVCCC